MTLIDFKILILITPKVSRERSKLRSQENKAQRLERDIMRQIQDLENEKPQEEDNEDDR